MANPAFRTIDNAAGIIVLLLLLVAVIGGQSQLYLQSQSGSDDKQQSQSRIRNAILSSDARESAELSTFIGGGETVPTRLADPGDIRLRDTDDDLPQSLAE